MSVAARIAIDREREKRWSTKEGSRDFVAGPDTVADKIEKLSLQMIETNAVAVSSQARSACGCILLTLPLSTLVYLP